MSLGDDEGQRLDYYRRHTDELSGEVLRLEMVATVLRHELRQKQRGLSLLSRLHNLLSPLQSLETMVAVALPEIAAMLSVSRAVFLRPESGETLGTGDSFAGFGDVPQNGILINRAATSTPLGDRLRATAGVPFLVAAPVMSDGGPLGLLTMGRSKEARPNHPPLDEGDLVILRSVAELIAGLLRIRRVSLLEAQMKEQSARLALAASIQRDLLPAASPVIAGYEIAARTLPAEAVGGDYFDFIPIDERRIAISLGDIAGKGLPAALLMANLQATIRGQTLWGPSPGDCLERASRLLFRSTGGGRYATLFYSVLNTQTHRLTFSNGGHNPPFFLADGPPARLREGGMVLGLFEASVFDEHAVMMPPGSVVVMYSDGITEALSGAEEEYGEERLLEAVERNRSLSCADLIATIFDEVQRFAGQQSQHDDMTLLAFRRL